MARTTTAARTCTIPGCGRPHCAKGLCQGHYRRWNKLGRPANPAEHPDMLSPVGSVPPGPPAKTCTTPGCGRKHLARGYCSRCYMRAQRAAEKKFA
ncbi:hypothetical protein [Candidatus Poriferisodalis sp.]|uniref:hypothetical protein n=1 Tax=Candidatus Poriferisodalis sp. TaxID=3101277 RepID=UPI003B018FAB